MIQYLEQIEYRRGMLDKGMKPESLPVKVWRGAKIPMVIILNNKAVINDNYFSIGREL